MPVRTPQTDRQRHATLYRYAPQMHVCQPPGIKAQDLLVAAALLAINHRSLPRLASGLAVCCLIP